MLLHKIIANHDLLPRLMWGWNLKSGTLLYQISIKLIHIFLSKTKPSLICPSAPRFQATLKIPHPHAFLIP